MIKNITSFNANYPNFTKTENSKIFQFMNPNFIRLKQHQFKHAKRYSYYSRPI